MEIIPAIDIIGGKCVRLIRGDFKLKKVYSSNPLEIARLFEKTGLKRLHLIDLEGAKRGKIKNWKIIKKIAENTNFKIEFGGGVRNEADIKKLFNLGIDRVILGSIILKEPPKFKNVLKQFGPAKIVVAADIKRNKIFYRGWQKEAKKELSSFLEDLAELGAKTIICTDIGRDGTLKGPNFSLYQKLVSKFPNLKIIASGGARNTQDLKRLSKIGVAGVIIGKAIYENKIKLSDLKPYL